jgi:hypothetical protein
MSYSIFNELLPKAVILSRIKKSPQLVQVFGMRVRKARDLCLVWKQLLNWPLLLSSILKGASEPSQTPTHSTCTSPGGNLLLFPFRLRTMGKGMPRHIKPIFSIMFYRANDRAQGSELGLYIWIYYLKRAVERLNGMIEFTSSMETGCVFNVRVPS